MKVYGCIVRRVTGKKQTTHHCPFYFVRLLLESADHANDILRLAIEQKLWLYGRLMNASYDRWPTTKTHATDPTMVYEKDPCD